MIRVLFVCMGNICRSPAAEGVFKSYLENQCVAEQFFIDSAGTHAYNAGEQADSRMRQAAARRAYTLDSTVRKVALDDLTSFDLLVAMDGDNLLELQSMAGDKREHIRLLGSFLAGYDSHLDVPYVPDPYYRGVAGFEQVLDMLESACPGILSYCLALDKSK